MAIPALAPAERPDDCFDSVAVVGVAWEVAKVAVAGALAGALLELIALVVEDDAPSLNGKPILDAHALVELWSSRRNREECPCPCAADLLSKVKHDLRIAEVDIEIHSR